MSNPYIEDLTAEEIAIEIARMESLLAGDLPFGEEQEAGLRRNIQYLKELPGYDASVVTARRGSTY